MLSCKQVKDYTKSGLLSGLQVSDKVELEGFRDKFESVSNKWRLSPTFTGIGTHWNHDFVWELASHSRIVECVRDIFGENVRLLGSHFFIKWGSSESGSVVSWHQDAVYWYLNPPVACTVWYAIDDSDRDNGCMRVIPGSFSDGIRVHGVSKDKGNVLSRNQAASVSDTEIELAVDVELKAGEVSIHNSLCLHASGENRSGRRRCGLALRYIPVSVKYDLNQWRTITL